MAKLLPESSEVPFTGEKAISLPLGMASPLWFAFAGAAATGAAFWWMSRWANPTNLEALSGWTAKTADTAADAVVEAAEVTAEAVQEAVAEPVLEAVAELAPEPVAETLAALAPEPVAEPIHEPVAEAAPEPVIEAAPEPEPEPAPEPVAAISPDDLTRIVGIGPKLSIALAERGLTTFATLSALTADDLAELDKALDLKGRAVRDAWVAQAARFTQGA